MTVYNFNLLLGFEANGVDVAQAHRLQLFRSLDLDTRFVFTQWPNSDQLDYFLSKGYDYEELLFAQLLFTDQQSAAPTLSPHELEEQLGLKTSQIIHETLSGRTYQLDEGELLVFVYDKKDFSKVQFIEYFSGGYLLKRETYASTKLVTDYFILNYQNGHVLAELGRRVYHNLDGSVGLEEILVNGKQRYLLQNEKLITHAELMESFVKKLQLKANDIVIMDRASNMDFARPLLEQESGARLGLVFHSEHTFGNQPFSYEYYYPVKYAHRFDFMIVSTDLQAKVLKESFEKEGKEAPRIYVIPVGSLKQLHYSEQDRKTTKVMTASRLIYSKRVDLAIRAVALAHEKGGDI
ncbi:MAG: glycosyl transferase family 1, partial [Streptococcus sp.]